MTAGSKKIGIGLIIASIHVNLFGIPLFPSCFGFALLYWGILEQERSSNIFILSKQKMKYYHGAAIALVLLSAILNFTAVFRLSTDLEVWNMIPSILEYVVLYYLLEAYTARKPELSGLRRGYALVMGSAVVGYGISLILHSGGWQIFVAVIILVCRGMVLVAIWRTAGLTPDEKAPGQEEGNNTEPLPLKADNG